jgi:hypothetical protein
MVMKKLKHTYSNCNQYAERDIEQLGDHYMVHIDAMTVESLHSKSSIAAELAFRDQRIAELEKPKEFVPLTPDWVYVKEDDIERMAKRFAELEKENALLKRVEKIFNDSPDLTFDYCQGLFQDEFQAHSLDQKAKALSEYSEHLISEAEEIPIGLEHKGRGSNIYNWQTHFARELRYRANKLSNAKEALKEQGE